MNDPRQLERIEENGILVGFRVPQYKPNDGKMEDAGTIDVLFCKGSTDPSSNIPRQAGLFTETILELARQYLVEVNVGDLATRETSMATTKIDESLMWLKKRSDDRKRREVEGTYQS